MFTKNEIIEQYSLTFDPGDKRNGSLYIGYKREGDFDLTLLIAALRAENIWSADAFKQVADEHRAAYKEQLDFVEAFSYKIDGATLLIARFDHPQYPSDEERWQAWVQFFDAWH